MLKKEFKISRIPLKLSRPVADDSFYGRDAELKYVWDYHISKGGSLLLSGPARVGKTSFARRLLALAEKNNWKTVYLNLAGIKTEKEFVKFLMEEIQGEKLGNQFCYIALKLLGSIKLKNGEKEISIDTDIWLSDAYGKIWKLIKKGEKMLIVIDELAAYLSHLLEQKNGPEKIEFFFEWLQKFREPEKGCWILCDSVEFENFVLKYQLDRLLAGFHTYNIEPFSEDKAKDFILHLDVDKNLKFTDEHIQYILNKLDCYLPGFIQIFVDRINFLVCVKGRQFSNDTIDEAQDCLIRENSLIHLPLFASGGYAVGQNDNYSSSFY